MKKIMRGVLLFGMLGGMLLSCGNNKSNDSQEQKKDSKVSEKVYKIVTDCRSSSIKCSKARF